MSSRQRDIDDAVIHLEPPYAREAIRKNILLQPRKERSTTSKLHTRLRYNVKNSALAKLRERLDRARSTMRSTGKGPMRRTARRTVRRTERRQGRRVARKTARRGKRKNRR